ncbi:MAG: DUF1538 family protein [Desulfitobacterium sp.]
MAKQTHMIMPGVNEMVFVWVLISGIGVFVGFALFRILKDLNIKVVFAALYIMVFLMAIFIPEELKVLVCKQA